MCTSDNYILKIFIHQRKLVAENLTFSYVFIV